MIENMVVHAFSIAYPAWPFNNVFVLNGVNGIDLPPDKSRPFRNRSSNAIVEKQLNLRLVQNVIEEDSAFIYPAIQNERCDSSNAPAANAKRLFDRKRYCTNS